PKRSGEKQARRDQDQNDRHAITDPRTEACPPFEDAHGQILIDEPPPRRVAGCSVRTRARRSASDDPSETAGEDAAARGCAPISFPLRPQRLRGEYAVRRE